MLKSQRRFGKVSKNENLRKIIHNPLQVEEVYNPKSRRLQPTNFGDKNKTNRCTIIKPSYKDFGQFTEILQSPNTVSIYLKCTHSIKSILQGPAVVFIGWNDDDDVKIK